MKLACASLSGTYVGKVDQAKLFSLPSQVRCLATYQNAWIVGSTAKWLLGLQDEVPKDIDVLVPLENWRDAAQHLPRQKTANIFGGFKVPIRNEAVDTVSMDVWPSSLECYLQNLPGGGFYAVHPNTGTSLKQDRAMGWVNSDGSGVAASDAEIARVIMPDLSI